MGRISDLTVEDRCAVRKRGHSIPQHLAVLIFGWGYGKCDLKGERPREKKVGATGMPWSCSGDKVKTEWLILAVENVCDRSKADQRLENKQKQNLRNYPFPGYRAKFRFIQELIPFTSMRGENACLPWNMWFPLPNYSFMHSNIWPMSPWPHQEHSCTACVS